MNKLEYMKCKLMDAIETQIDGNLEYANTQELGEAIDMVKDLSEAIYYCTITEAMEEKDRYEQNGHYLTTHYYNEPMMYRNYPDEYYSHDYKNGMRKSDREGYGGRYVEDASTRSLRRDLDYPMLTEHGSDRSSTIRRRYMDGRAYNDKQTQMKELEQYTQELATDLTDMIKDASPEEKQLLQQKISLLASKIK